MSLTGKRPFDVAGRIVSLLVFALGFIFLHWSAAAVSPDMPASPDPEFRDEGC